MIDDVMCFYSLNIYIMFMHFLFRIYSHPGCRLDAYAFVV